MFSRDVLFGLERGTTSLVSLGGVGRVFMSTPPWAGQKTVCMSWCGLTLHSIVLCPFRPKATRSVLSDTESTKRPFRVFSGDPEMFHPRKENQIIKTRLLDTCEA